MGRTVPVKDEAELRRLTGKPTDRLGRTGAKVRKRGRQPHQQLVNGCVDYLRLKGIPCVEFKQGMVRGPAGNMIRFGKAPGWPDIIGIQSERIEGHGLGDWTAGIFIGVECKVGRDKQRPEQVATQKLIEAAGGRYHVVTSMADVEKIFDV